MPFLIFVSAIKIAMEAQACVKIGLKGRAK